MLVALIAQLSANPAKIFAAVDVQHEVWRGAAGPGAVPELSVVVVAPAADCSAGPCAGVSATARHVRHRAEARDGHRCVPVGEAAVTELPEAVRAPAPSRATRQGRAGERQAGGHVSGAGDVLGRSPVSRCSRSCHHRAARIRSGPST